MLKSTPAWKKYTTVGCDGCDYLSATYVHKQTRLSHYQSLSSCPASFCLFCLFHKICLSWYVFYQGLLVTCFQSRSFSDMFSIKVFFYMFSIKVSSTNPTSPVQCTRTTASTRFKHIIPKSGLQMATWCRTRCSSSPTGRSWAPPSSPSP